MIITVIIPTYNRKRFVKLAIDSCLNQFLINELILHVVVIDDGSTDNTFEYLKSDYKLNKNVHILKIQNSERGAARNNGFNYANEKLKTDYVLFLDADDCLDQFSIYYFQEKLKQIPNAQTICAKYSLWYQQDAFGLNYPESFPNDFDIHSAFLQNDILALGCTLIHKNVHLKVDGFIEDKNLSGSEDRVYLAKVFINEKIIFSDHISTWYRQHEENTNISKFSTSMMLSTRYLEKELQKRYSKYEIELYKLHINLHLIGVNNADLNKGQPFLASYKLFKTYPKVILYKRYWKIIFSSIYRRVVKKHLALQPDRYDS